MANDVDDNNLPVMEKNSSNLNGLLELDSVQSTGFSETDRYDTPIDFSAASLHEEGLWSDEESDYADSDNDLLTLNGPSFQQDVFGNIEEDFEQDLKAVAGFRSSQRKGRGRRSRVDMPPSLEVQSLLSRANHAFAQEGNFEEAQRLAEEIVRIDNNMIAAWKMLGECHRQKGNERVNIEKCLIAWMAAAHLKPRDHELWATCARLSESLGFWEQADYCYNHAIQAKPSEVDKLIEYIWDRAILNQEHERYKKAIEGFQNLLNYLPHDSSVLHHLAEIYIELKEPREAIKLYEAAWNHFYRYPSPPVGQGVFDWSSLNAYAGLLYSDEQWHELIVLIKRGARWLRGRKTETHWDEIDDDREWDLDEKRRKFPSSNLYEQPENAFVLPFNLRAKLGIARLKIGDLAEATLHFDILKSLPITETVFILFEIAEAAISVDLYDLALSYYLILNKFEPACNERLYYSMGICYKELKEYTSAEECLLVTLMLNNRNIDAMVRLAEIYELLEDRDAALEIVTEIIALRNAMAPSISSSDSSSRQVSENASQSSSLITNQSAPENSAWRKRLEMTRSMEKTKQIQRWRAEQASFRFRKLEMLDDGRIQNDQKSINNWIETVSELVDEFINTRVFYPPDKKIKFRANFAQQHVQYGNLTEKLAGMATRLQDSLAWPHLEELDAESVKTKKEFRGYGLDRWFQLFMEFAIVLTKLNRMKQAHEVFRAALYANVFDEDPMKRVAMHWYMLACAIYAKDISMVSSVLRWVFNTFQFRQDSYRLWSAVLCSGHYYARYFVDSANQKFLLRLIKLMDQLVGEQDVQGAATLAKNEDGFATRPVSYDPLLLLLYGHIMAGGRSWIPALNYYSRAYAASPEDPMINLSLGLAYIHRAMQRQTDNRHYQIVQGFTFLYRYYDIRSLEGPGQKQEALYNLARAYHQLGLEHLAVNYYEDALRLSSMHPQHANMEKTNNEQTISLTYDLAFECAYNLRLIYVNSGNLRRAVTLTKRYLVF
ncbi:transcription factor tfiiic complex subunit sfc4 [Schizosaccharomyces japonicus yFS275]|uniref:Transcription factor tfiiic complex subunit sfc4 n=1 Tax=Schizosaccharomyces japonicus (strain yFS275 / FY16936) TaxID=402676 RepID=B6JZ05_SCHJY|nr:transcription factor tfiiic complex subunit sfc4 [Schizosaccharomyces japonicus yFS275]EEB06773.1 transcription factor tfiiic complex subunit sfc4 [Schizosaccharomyces japonicus yFS275]